jgi:hypothetical protein
MRPVPATNRRRIISDRGAKIAGRALIENQIAMAMSVTTIAHHITGVACFELPLRGESLAAWLNP